MGEAYGRGREVVALGAVLAGILLAWCPGAFALDRALEITAHVLSADGVATLGEVPQARVDPRTITLPVVDGKGIRFTRLSTEDGLSQTRVPQIVQDDQGFMWFGSEYGLNRYDGYKFKLFKHEL